MVHTCYFILVKYHKYDKYEEASAYVRAIDQSDSFVNRRAALGGKGGRNGLPAATSLLSSFLPSYLQPVTLDEVRVHREQAAGVHRDATRLGRVVALRWSRTDDAIKGARHEGCLCVTDGFDQRDIVMAHALQP